MCSDGRKITFSNVGPAYDPVRNGMLQEPWSVCRVYRRSAPVSGLMTACHADPDRYRPSVSGIVAHVEPAGKISRILRIGMIRTDLISNCFLL